MRRWLAAALLAGHLVAAGALPAAAQSPVAETKTLGSATLAAAVSGTIMTGGPTVFRVGRVEAVAIQCTITVAGGGTTAKAWLQTTLDGGTTWMDIASCAFTTSTATRAYNLTAAAVTSIATPTDGTLADNTAVNGFLGPQFRVKLTTTGTYTGASSFVVTAVAK